MTYRVRPRRISRSRFLDTEEVGSSSLLEPTISSLFLVPETKIQLHSSNSRVPIALQIVWLFVLALPVASIAWTITQEEIFREPREYCLDRSRNCPKWYQRKVFYMLTCEYCLSHYIAIFFLAISRFTLLLPGWRGFLIALFSLVWIGNFYMGLYGRLRLDIKSTKIDVKKEEHALNELREESEPEIHQVR